MSQPNERSRIGHNTNPLVTRTTPWPNYYHTYLFAVMRFNVFFIPYWFTIHNAFVPNEASVFHGVSLFMFTNQMISLKLMDHVMMPCKRCQISVHVQDLFIMFSFEEDMLLPIEMPFMTTPMPLSPHIIRVAHYQAFFAFNVILDLLHWFWRVGGGKRGIMLRWW